MPKTTERFDYRVEVYPHQPGAPYVNIPWREGEEVRACRDVEKDIKRHIDAGFTNIKWDSRNLCEFCGSVWTEESATYNGGCCDGDEENRPEADDG